MNYHKKYLKYKNKYLILKNKIQTGGERPYMFAMKEINLIKDLDMKKYLNPLHGFIMDKTGFISNNYFLHKNKLIDTKESKLIFHICKQVTNSIEITNKIYTTIKPREFGRFITLIYCDYIEKLNAYKLKLTTSSTKLKKTYQTTHKEEYKCLKIKLDNLKNKFDNDETTLKSYDLSSTFKVNTSEKNKNIFHILLYCLWWILGDKQGVKDYYLGINDTLTIINKYVLETYPIIEIPETYIEDIYTDEDLKQNINEIQDEILVLIKATISPFKIFSTDRNSQFRGHSFSDCGEVSLRNFFNLLIFDGTKFDINKLFPFGINNKLIEYYRVFDTFIKQASNIPRTFDGEEFTAREAWNVLISKYARDDVKFSKSADTFGYDITPGMCLSGTMENFERAIKNLLPGFTTWSKLNEMNLDLKFIRSQEGEDGGGFVNLSHSKLGKITLVKHPIHYGFLLEDRPVPYTGMEFKNIVDLCTSNFESVNFNNYLMVNYNSRYANDLITKISDTDLYCKVIELICVNEICENFKTNGTNSVPENYIDADKITGNLSPGINYNNLFFTGTNFNFVRFVPGLETINWIQKKQKIPLGYNWANFANDYTTVVTDLTPLTNINKIGPEFMKDINNTTLDLVPLHNLISVGPNFGSRVMKIICTQKQKDIILASNPNLIEFGVKIEVV